MTKKVLPIAPANGSEDAANLSSAAGRMRPETLGQAETWDKTRNHYSRFGLCDQCAAQAAWGHEDGWTAVRVPCPSCAERIAVLPVSQLNGWRSFRRGHTGDTAPIQRHQEVLEAVPQHPVAA